MVGAWAHPGDPDVLLEAAAAVDRMRSGGLAGGTLHPLFGIPFGAKDIIQSRDFPTEYGSEIFRGNPKLNQPSGDASCISRLKQVGAILLGKTDTTEFASFSANSSHNPHDPTRTPGGSSSGSAAAVADMQVPIAFGTQTNGSVIRPAGFCGVCGFKGSYGLVGCDGIFCMVKEFDTLGIYARNFDDIGAVHSTLQGQVVQPLPNGLDRPPRIAVWHHQGWEPGTSEANPVRRKRPLFDPITPRRIHLSRACLGKSSICQHENSKHSPVSSQGGIGPASERAMDDAVAMLRKLGATVEVIQLPSEFDDLCDQHTLICNDGLARGLAAKTEGPGATPAHLGMDLYHTYSWHGGSRYPMMTENLMEMVDSGLTADPAGAVKLLSISLPWYL